MLNGKKIAVVMPGLRVARTLERTVKALPTGIADEILYVDDGSSDDSIAVARGLGLRVFAHSRNLGYGAGQKTLFREALALGADCIVMVHPDFQYKPELMPAMASMVVHAGYDLVLGSRLLVGGALKGGMPRWKFVANRFLTVTENLAMGSSLSEFHTGYRAFSANLVRTLPLAENRNDYVFDNELIAQCLYFGRPIGELSCPARYFDEMGTITFGPGVKYGLGCLKTAARLLGHRTGLARSPLFDPNGRTVLDWTEGQAL